MEEITTLLKKLQNDLSQQNIEIKSLKEDISKPIIENMNIKFNEIMSKNEELEEIVNNQQNTIEKLERQVRMKNIVLFGLEEEEKSYEELEKRIILILNEHLAAECNTYDIESAMRLGIKGDKTRPIKITFSKLNTKLTILKRKKQLERTNYYIKEDFSPQVIEKRKELQKEVDIARSQGKMAVLRYDKIVYLEQRKNNQHSSKRKPSKSPENQRTFTPFQENRTSLFQRTTKKTKVDMRNYFIPKETDTSSSPNTMSSQTMCDTRIEQ